MRQWLVRLIPATIKTATGVGIGFLLTEIGLSYSSGIGAITGGSTSTPLALGGCPPDMINPETGACTAGQMTNPSVRSRSRKRGKEILTYCNYETDVARRLLRWYRDSLPNGVQSQVRSRHRHCACLCHLVAVSTILRLK